jgi:capping protein (actin filament) muscle Z-line, beta
LLCDYNRDGDSYRSPWSNEFDPPIDDGTVPSERIRKLEVAANEAFDVYRGLYYEGGVGSTYFWDLDDGFAGVVLLKKGVHIPGSQSGCLRAKYIWGIRAQELIVDSCFARFEKSSSMG